MMDERKCSEMDTILKVHRQRIDELEKMLSSINTQLVQIKACAYGAVGYAVATQLGVIEAIKLGAG
jgi:hypothetical protein